MKERFECVTEKERNEDNLSEILPIELFMESSAKGIKNIKNKLLKNIAENWGKMNLTNLIMEFLFQKLPVDGRLRVGIIFRRLAW